MIHFRASVLEVHRWSARAKEKKLGLSPWIRAVLDAECVPTKAHDYREKKDVRAEVKSGIAPRAKDLIPDTIPAPAGELFSRGLRCDHQGYEGKPFCFKCGQRVGHVSQLRQEKIKRGR